MEGSCKGYLVCLLKLDFESKFSTHKLRDISLFVRVSPRLVNNRTTHSPKYATAVYAQLATVHNKTQYLSFYL